MARRARFGVLAPGGSPTVEPERYRVPSPSIAMHLARLRLPAGEPGSRAGELPERRRLRAGSVFGRLAGVSAARSEGFSTELRRRTS
jgi:hypothetical protein